MSAVEVRTDFKAPARIVDKKAIVEFLRICKLESRRCACCPRFVTQTHHIVFRSHGGDDLFANFIGLCTGCHDALHHGLPYASKSVRHNIGQSLTEQHIRYVLRKQGIGAGQDYLRRRYYRPVSAKLTKQMRRELA